MTVKVMGYGEVLCKEEGEEAWSGSSTSEMSFERSLSSSAEVGESDAGSSSEGSPSMAKTASAVGMRLERCLRPTDDVGEARMVKSQESIELRVGCDG